MGETLPVLSVEEAKERIKNGQPIEGVRIDRLSLANWRFEGPITILDCKIGLLDLNKGTFFREVDIRRCDIGQIVFSEAVFEGPVNFKKSTFYRGRFQRVTFKDQARFENTGLAHCSFYQSRFEGGADFGFSTFTSEPNFTEVVFGANTRFANVKVQGDANFSKTHWEGTADLRQMDVDGDLDLTRARFDVDCLLTETVIRLSLWMGQCHFQGATNLAAVMAGRGIILEGVKVGAEQGFSFINAMAPKIVLDRDTVEGHILAERQGDFSQAVKEYAFLRTNFEMTNRFDDEDWAYYQFKRMGRRARKRGLNPLRWLHLVAEYLFLDLGCGYGTKPFRTLVAVFVLIGLFGGIYWALGLHTDVDFGAPPWLNTVLNAMNTSLVVFSGGYGDFEYQGWPRTLAMLEYLLGIVFLGLFVVAFSRKVIR